MDLADEARARGKTDAADRLLLLAWAAYDDPDEMFGLEDEPEAHQVCPFPKQD